MYNENDGQRLKYMLYNFLLQITNRFLKYPFILSLIPMCIFIDRTKKINIDVINVARHWVILIASVHDNIDSKFETNHWSYAWLNISIALSIFGEIRPIYNLRYLAQLDSSVFTLNVNGFFFNSFCLISSKLSYRNGKVRRV